MPDPFPAETLLTETEGPADPVAWDDHLEDWWDEPLPPDYGPHPDLHELQGAWIAVAGQRQAQLLVAGNRFTFRFAAGDIYMGTFDLDPAANPKRMDMRIDEGPGPTQGKTTLCIYDLDLGSLHWCATAPGEQERLVAFPAESDRRYLRMVFRREEVF